ncbi:hypothetical protein LBMAG51_02120 [Phycisphaerae bacterium]|nr:hypothetical protein LBMAG51_02120 [Phycisphaerae bacterium]
MAAALSFRTLFGLVPVLFVATLAARSLAGENFPKFVESLAEMAGLDEIGIDVVTEGSSAVEKQPLSNWIEELVRFSGTIDLSALGIIGVIVVLFSAIWLIVAIENTFNIVCRSANSRAWHRRILVYWSMLTLGPILLAMLPVLDNELHGFVDGQTTLPTSYVIVRPILGFCLLFLLLLFAYSVIPTVRMRWKTIVTGALVGAIGLELGRRFLGIYMEKAFTGNRLYGSLGLVPIFMFWIYAMWLIVLFGLQVSSLFHALISHERIRSILSHQSSTFEPAIAVSAMEWICDHYRKGKETTLTSMSDTLKLDLRTATRLTELLAESNLVIYVPENGRILPARAVDSITLAEALRIGFRVASIDRASENGDFIESLRSAQLESVGNQTFGSSSACQRPISNTELKGSNL